MVETDVLVAVIFAGRLVQNGLVPAVPSAMLVAGVSARTPTAATPTAEAIRVLESRFIVCPSHVRLRGISALRILLRLRICATIYLGFVLGVALRQLQHMRRSTGGGRRRGAGGACRSIVLRRGIRAMLPHIHPYSTRSRYDYEYEQYTQEREPRARIIAPQNSHAVFLHYVNAAVYRRLLYKYATA